MHPLRRIFAAVVSGLALIVAAALPAAALPDSRFLTVDDPAADMVPLGGGTKADQEAAQGLDVLRVRHRVLNNQLVIVSKYRDLTRANARVNPDTVPIGGTFTMFSTYVEAKPGSGDGYVVYFNARRLVEITTLASAPVPCSGASRSRIDLDLNRVRYVVPLSCIPGVPATRTKAQATSYKVVDRRADGVETIELVTLDVNERPAPRLALR